MHTGSSKRRIRVSVLLGPTASGKSALALRLARDLDVEILSCDSRQIYRGMNIGTAKPLKAELAAVKHRFIDIVEPSEAYSAFRFADEAAIVLRDLAAEGRSALICGGTGLYYRSLSRGMGPRIPSDPAIREQLWEEVLQRGSAALHADLAAADPESAVRIHANDGVRIVRALEVIRISGVSASLLNRRTTVPEDFEFCEIVIGLPREALYERINQRVDVMAEAGLYDEFRELRRRGYRSESPGMLCLGYRELFAVERGDCSLSEALIEIKQNTRKYAKRQMTWFRTQTDADHYDMSADRYSEILARYRQFLNG